MKNLKILSLWFACTVATVASAQTFLIGNPGDSQSIPIYGQSFIPSVAGSSYPDAPDDASFSLMEISFAQFYTGTAPESVFILETSVLTDAPDLQGMISTVLANPEAYVLGESDSFETAGGLIDGSFPDTYNTHTFLFSSGVLLDANTSYTALLSNGTTSLRVIGNGSAYAGGSILDTSGYDAAFDAGFQATLAAVPEPGAYAVIAGALALAFVYWRRRRLALNGGRLEISFAVSDRLPARTAPRPAGKTASHVAGRRRATYFRRCSAAGNPACV